MVWDSRHASVRMQARMLSTRVTCTQSAMGVGRLLAVPCRLTARATIRLPSRV